MVTVFVAFFIAVLVFRLILTDCDGKYAMVLLNGFVLRLLVMLIDYFQIIEIPFSNNDAQGFHEVAVANQNSYYGYSTNYTVFLTGLYYVTDCARWFAQYVNVVFGVLLLIYLRKILFLLDVDEKKRKYVLIIASYMPFPIIYSALLLREAWVSFFVILSLYYFVRWYLSCGKNGVSIFLTMLSVIFALLMHEGCIGLVFGYIFAFLFYNRKENRIRLSASTYIAFFLLSVIGVIFILNLNIFLEKFAGALEDPGEALQAKNAGEGGGADYLTWIDFSNPFNILLFAPLKIIYFLFSPIITDWRGLNDIIAFLLDSLIYIYVFWIVIKGTTTMENRLLKKFVLITLSATILIFSFGTTNSGTAIRHRSKLLAVVLVVYAMSSYSGEPSKKLENKNLPLLEN